MVDGKIELEETELLVLQHLLDGENFGMGYDDFPSKNIDHATFRAPDRGRLYRTEVVGYASDSEGGRLSELEFRIEVETGDTKPDREINAIVNRDGVFRSLQNGPAELAHRFMANLEVVMQFRDKLIPLSKLLDEYVAKKSILVGPARNDKLDDTNIAFGNLIENELTGLDYDDREIEVYKSIIANGGINLSKLPLNDDQYPNITGFNGNNIDYGNQISDFFEIYAVRVEGAARPDFDLLAGHLNHILKSGDEYDSLPGMLQFIEKTYDI